LGSARCVVPVVGLITAYYSGAFLETRSWVLGWHAIGGGFDGIACDWHCERGDPGLSVPDDQKQQWIGHVAVADAICYIFGTLGVILVCGTLGPKLLQIDLRAESRKVEEKLGIKHSKSGVSSGWQPISYRAYTIRPKWFIRWKDNRGDREVRAHCAPFVERVRP